LRGKSEAIEMIAVKDKNTFANPGKAFHDVQLWLDEIHAQEEHPGLNDMNMLWKALITFRIKAQELLL